MDAGLFVALALIAIIIIALFALFAWARYTRTSAEAYSTRQSANAHVLDVIARLPRTSHHITITRDAVMSITPAPDAPTASTTQPPATSSSVRYLIDAQRPDSMERRNLLAIVEHSIRKHGDSGLIRSGNKCYSDGLINPTDWQSAISYGADWFGVVPIPGDKTIVGSMHGKLSELADAINKHETVDTPTPAPVL